MHIQDLAGKKICILGFGREGRAMAAALKQYAPSAAISVMDSDASIATSDYPLLTGTDYLQGLDRFDAIIKSPGIPPSALLTPHSSLLTSSTQIFLDSIASSGATIVGITGSKGKSTTSSLLHEILKSGGKDSHLIGNIGEPAIAHLADTKPGAIFVLEMSSYQLTDITVSPPVAVITSFFPEHLDYHSTRPLEADSLMASQMKECTPLENYLEAKKHITRFQSKDDIAFFLADSKEAKLIATSGKGKAVPFSASDAPVTLDEILLRGEHNLANIAAAYKVALHLGVKKDDALRVIRHFKGLPHRLESIGVFGGVEWINDSISTAPETAIAALNALGDRVRVLIVGGQDRGYDFAPLAKRLVSSPVSTVVLLPDSGVVIGKAIEHAGAGVILALAETLNDAVATALRAALDARKDDAEIPIVLLSPAAPSYGHFKNFEDRGDQFRVCVRGGKADDKTSN